jgi:hypothetical protein
MMQHCAHVPNCPDFPAHRQRQIADLKAARALHNRRLRNWRGRRPAPRYRPGMNVITAGRLHERKDNMTQPDQAGTDIKAGDKVRRRDTEEKGDVTEILPVYGGFEGGSYAVLLVAAMVRWHETRQRTLVRVDDLIKLT